MVRYRGNYKQVRHLGKTFMSDNSPIKEALQLLYVTTSGREEALTIAKALVGERLVACANVLDGATSLYWWEGEVQQDQEAVLVLKTRRARVAEVTERIKLCTATIAPAWSHWTCKTATPTS